MAASTLAAIVVMGVSGAGKSTVGKLIAARGSAARFATPTAFTRKPTSRR